MSEQVQTGTAPTSAPAQTSQSAPQAQNTPGADTSFIQKAQGKGPQYTETAESKVPGQPDSSEGAPKEQKPTVDPDTQKFLQEQKVDLGDLAGDPRIAPLVSGYRDLHTKHAQLETDGKRYEQLIKDIQLINGKQPESAEPKVELSPMETLEQKYQSIIVPLLETGGAGSLTELRDKFPQVFDFLKVDQIVENYNQEFREAMQKEIDWKFNKQNRDRETAEAKSRIQSEGERVKGLMSENFIAGEKADPQIKDNFSKSGVNDFINYMSKISGHPVEYYFADKTVFNHLAKAAKAVAFMDSLPDHDKEVTQRYEKDLIKTKAAEHVGQSDPLPDDHNLAFIRKAQNRK